MEEVILNHGERLTKLEVLTEKQQEQIDEHKAKIQTLENINHVLEFGCFIISMCMSVNITVGLMTI